MREVLAALEDYETRAVFVHAEQGLGASVLLRAVEAKASRLGPVLAIRGSPSLSGVPFGVLAPYLADVPPDDMRARIHILSAVLSEIDRRRAPGHDGSSPALLVVDDAYAIDPATAELIVSLVLAGSVKLVASHKQSVELPEPLPQLWRQGLAEQLQLQPLTVEQGQVFCRTMLGGPVLAGTGRYFWSLAGGNPLLLKLIIEDAVANGQLMCQGGTWFTSHERHAPGPGLREVVRRQLRGLSAQGRAAVNLIALSEPVEATVVADLVGQEATEEVLSKQLAQESEGEPGILRLMNAIYGEVIRDLVPRAQSLLLHQQLVGGTEASIPANPEGLLRRATWALDSGAAIDDEALLRAAVVACKLFQGPTALRLAGAISGPDHALRARIVAARAYFTMGDSAAAAKLLEPGGESASSGAELLFGSLLRAVTRSAMGLRVEIGPQDAAELRRAGERLDDQQRARASIPPQVTRRAQLLEIMAQSQDGRYADMGPLIATVLEETRAVGSDDQLLDRCIALAMDAERLCALGSPRRAQQRAAEALAIVPVHEWEVFFLPELITNRQFLAALCAGDWADSEQNLQTFSVDAGPAVVSFGGASDVVQGLIHLRQGRLGQAISVLEPALDVLKFSDPHQLRPACAAMAFYSAAAAGDLETARRLEADQVETPGIFLLTTHARAYVAAGREHLDRNGRGVAALVRQADEAGEQGALLIELHALDLAVGLGATELLGRLAQVAEQVEGPWAAALGVYAGALLDGDGSALVSAGDGLLAAGLFALARESYARALAALKAEGRGRPEGRAGTPAQAALAGQRRVQAALDEDGEIPFPDEDGEPAPAIALTRREHEIVNLAVEGLPDRDIAAALHLSIRTVQGHLYRAYAKLGISGRSELRRQI